MMKQFLAGNGPSNTIKIALCAMGGVWFMAGGILWLSTQHGDGPLRAIEALENLGMSLASLGSIAAVAKGGRDAAKDMADSMKHRARPTTTTTEHVEVHRQETVKVPPPVVTRPADPDRTDPKVAPARRTTDDVPLPDE